MPVAVLLRSWPQRTPANEQRGQLEHTLSPRLVYFAGRAEPRRKIGQCGVAVWIERADIFQTCRLPHLSAWSASGSSPTLPFAPTPPTAVRSAGQARVFRGSGRDATQDWSVRRGCVDRACGYFPDVPGASLERFSPTLPFAPTPLAAVRSAGGGSARIPVAFIFARALASGCSERWGRLISRAAADGRNGCWEMPRSLPKDRKVAGTRACK